jgi:hypothetical protein
VRGGKLNPTLIRNYAGGLAVSASIPLAFSGTTLGSNPFTVRQARNGVDIGGRVKSLFVQGGVVNGEDVPGQAAVNHHKDYYGTAEVTAPDGVSGVGLYYYHGPSGRSAPVPGGGTPRRSRRIWSSVSNATAAAASQTAPALHPPAMSEIQCTPR